MSRFVPRLLFSIVLALLFVGACAAIRTYRYYRPSGLRVPAFAQTDPVRSGGDAADDPAIWVDPEDPARSLILGTNKRGGIGLYDLAGREVDYQPLGELNNVDLRDAFPFSDGPAPIVVSGEMRRCQLVAMTLDRAARRLREVPGSRVNAGVEPEGIALYRSPRSGRTFVFAVGDEFETGDVNLMEQWELTPDRAGGVRFERVRRIEIGGDAEGVVADDAAGAVYVSEESVGIWRYDAEPDASTTSRVLVDTTTREGHLRGDVEGLAIYRGAGEALLFASSQGSDDFVIYRLLDDAPPRFLLRFRVTGGDLDDVTHTDGIEVTPAALGGDLERGVFVCQDDENPSRNQDFKLVSMSEVLAAMAVTER